jgi:hypothetical protein
LQLRLSLGATLQVMTIAPRAMENPQRLRDRSEDALLGCRQSLDAAASYLRGSHPGKGLNAPRPVANRFVSGPAPQSNVKRC